MKERGLFRRAVSLLLASVCTVGCIGAAAHAEESAAETSSIINDKELTGIVESFMSERGISKNGFSIGFCYTVTGDTWYYNGDKWFYPASVYKVPLMMQIAEKVSSGELTQEDTIQGLSVSTLEEYILTYSNNDYAHTVRTYLGGDEVWRDYAKQYANLSDEEYDPDYMEFCYFSNRYITEVMKTLYFSPERFPNIIDCLLSAEPEHYFKLSMRDTYPIAQKYGSFCDSYGQNFNHTTGIVYTENPCIITVMTCNVPNYEKVISDAAIMMTEYSLSLDKKLKAYKEEQAAAAAEAKRLEMEKAAELEKQKEIEAREKAEAEAKQQEIESQTTLQNARKTMWIQLAALAAGVTLVIIVSAAIVRSSRRRKRRKRYEAYRRRYEAEQRAAQGTRHQNGGYKPKH